MFWLIFNQKYHKTTKMLKLYRNLHPLVQSSVLDQMETQPKLVVLDTMNFLDGLCFTELMDVIKRVDVITINDDDGNFLENILVKAAAKIQTMGPKYVVIKGSMELLFS
jgi:hypothetical protein